MKYVIRYTNSAFLSVYYTGPQSYYVYETSQWDFSFNKATIFDTLEQARDFYNKVKSSFIIGSFSILEYHPATVGNVVLSEKDMLISDLQEIVHCIDDGRFGVSWRKIEGIVPTINSAIKFIERNVNG